MPPSLLILLALALATIGWIAARGRAYSFANAQPTQRLAALPTYHAWFVALSILIPAILFIVVIALAGSIWIVFHLNSNMMPGMHRMPETTTDAVTE